MLEHLCPSCEGSRIELCGACKARCEEGITDEAVVRAYLETFCRITGWAIASCGCCGGADLVKRTELRQRDTFLSLPGEWEKDLK